MADQNKVLQKVLQAYVGSYTSGESRGIYHGLFHTDTGRLELTGSTGGIPNPSFLAVEPMRRYLYAVSEVDDFQGKPTGGVYAYALDESTGEPSLLNSQASEGRGPCHRAGASKFIELLPTYSMD